LQTFAGDLESACSDKTRLGLRNGKNFRVGGADRRPWPVPNREITEMLARLALALLILAATAAGAEAHHAMGGTMPQTLAQGLLSGLAHPVIGLDHLAFTVAAGSWRRGSRRRSRRPR